MSATQGLNGPTVVSSTAKLAYLDTWTNYWINQSTGVVSSVDGTTRLWSAATDPTVSATGWTDWDTTCGPDASVPAVPAPGRPLASYPTTPALDASCSSWPCTTVDNSASGGSSNSLADVAAYYYKTDLRPSGTTGFNGADVSANKVKSSGTDTIESDMGKWQHMSTFTMGLGVSGTIPFNKEYYKKPLITSPTSFQDIRCLDSSNNPKADANDCLPWPKPVPIDKSYPVSDSRYDPNPGTRVDDLWHAAVNGRGRYFSAANPDDVLTGLQDALEAINAEGGAGTGSATSTQEPVSSNDWTFAASFRTVEWSGNIEARSLNTDVNSCETSTTACTDQGGRLVGTTCGASQSGFVCTFEGSTRVGPPHWTAQAKLDGQTKAACDDRNIYLLRMGATDNLVPFTWNTYSCGGTSSPVGLPSTGLNATEQAYFTSTDSPSYTTPFPMRTWAQFLDMSPSQKTNAQGANLLNYLRGQTGMTNFAKGVSGKYFRNRTHALGDIVSSQPRYVRAPNAQFTDTGYALYKNKTGVVDRPAMLYVGANDGMMHAFRVGSTTSDPVGGTEAWAVVPSVVVPNLYKLADTEYRSNHSFYVDGTPVIADVYDRHQTSPGICAGATVATTARDCWKTILVGGLGAGGRGYYALDISDPTAPKALWEFKWSDTCYNSSVPSTHYTDCHLGNTYGLPMVTKLPDGTWVAMVGSGMNNVNSPTKSGDGVGYLYVLDVITGEILHKISTGVGSAATTSSALTGTLTLNGTTLVTGSGTTFTTQLVSGQTIVVNGQMRVVQSITDDTNLRVTVAFPASANGTYSGTAFSGTGSADFSHINAYVENYIQDNTAKRIYGGDRLGNVWRIDLSNLTASGGSVDIAKLATLLDPSGNPQPITTTPQMMNVGAAQSHMVYVGTGRYLGESDLSDSQVQTIYALTDDLTIRSDSATYSTNGGTVLPTAPLTLRQQLNQVVLYVDATDSNIRRANSPVCSAEATAAGGCSGWYVDLPSAGERVNLPMRLVQGSLTANTNATVVGACDSGGNSWTNTFDAATGTAVAGSDGVISRYMAGAIAVGVTYIRSQSGRILAIITKSDSTQQVLEVPTQQASPLGRRTGWRDLLN